MGDIINVMKIHPGSIERFKTECPKSVPDSLLNERWASRIHGQTLARLNERGGMSIKEILMNIEQKQFDYKPESIDDLNKLKEYLK